jgi:antitoxin component YwqK of YwqJK toxin-antitoxin module
MIRSTLTLISLAFLIAGCADPPTLIVKDPDTAFVTSYTIKNDTLYHGPYTKKDAAGILLEKGTYVEGQLHGMRELFHPDGQVKVRERYKNGMITDLYEYFYPNGQVELKGYYINGEMYGVWRKYYKDGSLLEEVTMSGNEENGPFTEFHPNGKLQAQGYYLHGPNEDGVLKLYDESGELYKTMLCDSGWCSTTWKKE